MLKMSTPSTLTVPCAGRTKPLRTLSTVVLPAPLGPINPVTGASSVAVRLLTALTPPKVTDQAFDLDHAGFLTQKLPGLRPDHAGQIDQLAGNALRRGDQGMQQADAEDHGRDIAVDSEIVEQRRERAQQTGRRRWGRPSGRRRR